MDFHHGFPPQSPGKISGCAGRPDPLEAEVRSARAEAEALEVQPLDFSHGLVVAFWGFLGENDGKIMEKYEETDGK